jgi:hypothetical protein
VLTVLSEEGSRIYITFKEKAEHVQREYLIPADFFLTTSEKWESFLNTGIR